MNNADELVVRLAGGGLNGGNVMSQVGQDLGKQVRGERHHDFLVDPEELGKPSEGGGLLNFGICIRSFSVFNTTRTAVHTFKIYLRKQNIHNSGVINLDT